MNLTDNLLDRRISFRYLNEMSSLPEKAAPNTVYLVDVSSFVFRAYYSVGYLSKQDGTPTGAVFGVANMLVSLIDGYAPSHLAVAMDSKTPTFRREIYPEYKANRPPPPDDLKQQFPMVETLLEGFGLPVLQRDGFEADDVIATLVESAKAEGFNVVIVSGDKDLMQLVCPGVVMFDTMKNKMWDEAAVTEKWGVPASLLGDLLALAGDSSDNIPGVPRVGPKTAAPLLVEHGGLDALLANRDSLKSKALAKRLGEHEADARLSRNLVSLKDDVPLDIKWDQIRYRAPEPLTLARMLSDFEFHRLKERLVGDVDLVEDAPEVDYRTITDIEGLNAFVDEIRKVGRFAVDLETTSKDAVVAQIVGVALSCASCSAVYVPVAHKEGGHLELQTVLDVIGPLLTDPTIGVIAQNVKYEDTVFRRHGIYIENVVFDPMLASYLIRAESRRHGLDVLAKDYLKRRTISYDEVTEKKKGEQLTFDAVSVSKATEYAGEDADIAFSLAEEMASALERAEATKLFHELEIPLARVLTEMELNGVRVDTVLLTDMSQSFVSRIDSLEVEAEKVVGHSFNLGSPKQLQEILFDELKLPTQKKTKTGFSTDSEVLEVLAPLHPLPALLLEHRMLTKLKSTYLDALPKLVNKATGRIHTSFNQAIAATGRLSSSNPNLQNIPIRSDLGREIRRAFVAPEGALLLSADYSQVELRVLAHLSQDPALLDAFNNNQDIHARTARAIFGRSEDEIVLSQERAQAKAVNFGVIYGKTAFSLAKELNISRTEAGRFIDEYFKLYSGVKTFMDEVIEQAKADLFVKTLLGRKRLLRDLKARNFSIRSGAERMARNTPIQGTAADLLKLSMIKVCNRLREEAPDIKMVLTVHDELIFEVPEEKVEMAKSLIKTEMEGAISLSVPLVVDVGVGSSWADAH